MSGRFITLEGGEGVGKTTNAGFIEAYLGDKGIGVVRTREPGGTPLGEQIRTLLLQPGEMDSRAELLLMFAARAQHIREVIRPALDAGQWVICDRFTDASFAYQGGGRGLDVSAIAFLETWVQDGLRPDLTLLLDAPADVGLTRAKSRQVTDRFESEAPVFYGKVREAYLARLEQEPARIRRIDAGQPIGQVQADIAAHLDTLLAEPA